MGFNNFVLYAEEGAQAQASGGGIFSIVLTVAVWIGVFYFILIRPQRKKAKDHKELIESLSKGDNVVTSGGIKGEIVSITDKYYEIRVDKGVKLTIKKSAVSTVVE